LPPRQKTVQQLLQHPPRRFSKIRAIAERLELFHIRALAQLQLHGMDVLRRVAVIPGDMAALEAPVEHMGVLRIRGADGFQLAGQFRSAGGAVEGAEVEVRQLAVEQVGITERIECASNNSA